MAYPPDMRLRSFIISLTAFTILQLGPLARAEVLDGSDLQKDQRVLQEKIGSLPIEDQLLLRAAEQEASADPAVIAALQRRNKAIEEFRFALRASMIKSNPKVEAILAKVANTKVLVP
jgi:hypothetical protein